VSLASATAVHSLGQGLYSGDIEPGWDIVGNANGGYLLAITARAASASADGLVPVTVTAHFLAPAKPGPVTIATHMERRGRRFSTVRATMSNEEKPLVSMLGSFTQLPEGPHPVERIDAAPPEMPNPWRMHTGRAHRNLPPAFHG
jgi:acyl-CoA thioesterase